MYSLALSPEAEMGKRRSNPNLIKLLIMQISQRLKTEGALGLPTIIHRGVTWVKF